MLRRAVVCCRIIIRQAGVGRRYRCVRCEISLHRQPMPMSTIANGSLPMSAALPPMHCMAATVGWVYWWKVPSERLRFGNFPLSVPLHSKNEETYRESFETLQSQIAILNSKHLKIIKFEQFNFFRLYSSYFEVLETILARGKKAVIIFKII